MKKFLYSFLSVFILFSTISPICLAQNEVKKDSQPPSTESEDGDDIGTDTEKEGPESRRFLGPTTAVDSIYGNANKKQSNQVQYTEYDVVTSKTNRCAPDSRFTISNTLCHLRDLSRSYLQYVMYIGLTAATILLIRNGFKIVTSTDREKQITTFKKNLTYIIIGVFLLIGFYYIINLFVAVVNLLTD